MMSREGGEPVRRKMVSGRAQWWVMRGTGEAVVGTTIRILAQGLGITEEKSMAARQKATTQKLVTITRAGTLSGYSQSAISRAVIAGQIAVAERRGKATLLRIDDVLKWSEEHKKMGGLFRPRTRRKTHQLKAGPRFRLRGSSLSDETNARLEHYLDGIHGTPFAMSKSEFIDRAVSWALEKLA